MSHNPPPADQRPQATRPTEGRPDNRRDFALPPQDQPAEIGVLGAVLRDNRLFDDLRPLVSADDFYFAANRAVYEAVERLVADGVTADLMAVYRATRDGPTAADVTPEFLAQLWDADPTGANGRYNAAIVRDRAAARRLIHLCQEMARAAYAGEPAADLAARFEADVFRVSDAADRASPTRLSAAVAEVLADLDRQAAGEAPRHIPTGLDALDNVIGGLHRSRLVILAGRPGGGKSALALHFAMQAARQGVGTLVFTMEMKAKEWAARALAAHCSVPLNQLTGATPMDDPAARRLAAGVPECRVALWLDDRGGHTADTIAAVARRAVRRHKVGLIVVDYLGLIDHGGRASDNQATLIANTTRRLKRLAMQLDIPVVCLAQLNREVEKRADGRPQLSDLRDSGAVEQDADDVLMLWPQPVPDGPGAVPAAEQEIRVCVEKQRNGPRAVVPLSYVRRFTRFEPMMVTM